MSLSINRRTLLAGAAAVGMTTCVSFCFGSAGATEGGGHRYIGNCEEFFQDVVEWPIWTTKKKRTVGRLNSGTWGRTSEDAKYPAFEAALCREE